MARALVVVALYGCAVAQDPAEPSRLLTGFGFRGGIAAVHEDSPDGPASSGVAVGAHGFASYRATDRLAVGLGLDFTLSGYDAKVPDHAASLWWVMLPTANLRVELGRFAVATWGGYYVGFRSISEPGGSFGTRVYSSQKMHGGALGVMLLARVRIANGPSLEAGPYLQLAHLISKADDNLTSDFDEDGLASTALVGGLALQLAFGAPRTRGQ